MNPEERAAWRQEWRTRFRRQNKLEGNPPTDEETKKWNDEFKALTGDDRELVSAIMRSVKSGYEGETKPNPKPDEYCDAIASAVIEEPNATIDSGSFMLLYRLVNGWNSAAAGLKPVLSTHQQSNARIVELLETAVQQNERIIKGLLHLAKVIDRNQP